MAAAPPSPRMGSSALRTGPHPAVGRAPRGPRRFQLGHSLTWPPPRRPAIVGDVRPRSPIDRESPGANDGPLRARAASRRDDLLTIRRGPPGRPPPKAAYRPGRSRPTSLELPDGWASIRVGADDLATVPGPEPLPRPVVDRALDEPDGPVGEADVGAARVPGGRGDHARDARVGPPGDITIPARPMVRRRGGAEGEQVGDPPVPLPSVDCQTVPESLSQSLLI